MWPWQCWGLEDAALGISVLLEDFALPILHFSTCLGWFCFFVWPLLGMVGCQMMKPFPKAAFWFWDHLSWHKSSARACPCWIPRGELFCRLILGFQPCVNYFAGCYWDFSPVLIIEWNSSLVWLFCRLLLGFHSCVNYFVGWDWDFSPVGIILQADTGIPVLY